MQTLGRITHRLSHWQDGATTAKASGVECRSYTRSALHFFTRCVLTHASWRPKLNAMGHALLRRLEQTRPFADAVEEAGVNLLLAAAWLDDRVERTLEPLGITHRQYNVLRILKGAYPSGHPRCEIARRMIDRAPDVTRLVDRLESRGLVERSSDAEDGRRSVTQLTRAGLAVLARATEALAAVHEKLDERMSVSQARALSRTCESLYGPDLE